MRLVIIVFNLFLATYLSSQNADKIGIPGPIVFNQTIFEFAKAESKAENVIKQDYIVKGESVDQFTQKMTVHRVLEAVTVDELVNNKLTDLEKRKKTDHQCTFSSSESADGKTFTLDFFTTNPKERIVDFNLQRYLQLSDEHGVPSGVVIYTYIIRGAADDIPTFKHHIKEHKGDYIGTMQAAYLPVSTK